jgi:hypothetical protein
MKRKKLSPILGTLAIASTLLVAGCGKSNTSSSSYNPIPGTIGTGSLGRCVPINSSQIPFTASNIYFSSVNIRAGIIPGSGTIGQVLVGGSATGGPYQRSGVDGVLSMSISPIASVYPTTTPISGVNTGPTVASASGFISISVATQRDIVYKFSNLSGYNPYATGSTTVTNYPCVSGIAIDVGHYYNTIYGGNAYLYLNNSQHGYSLYF